MDLGHLPKLRFALSEQLSSILEPREEVRPFAAPEVSAGQFLRALAKADLLVDAVRYLAVALPRREAVWWACMTKRLLTPSEAPPLESACWAAAETWVAEPTEAHRVAAYPCAEALRFETPAAYAALGVFWSGGSLAPPETEMLIPPGDGLTGSAVAASVMLSCVPGPAKMIADRHRAAFAIGVDIANGGIGQVVVELPAA